jgi:hypothetical protein
LRSPLPVLSDSAVATASAAEVANDRGQRHVMRSVEGVGGAAVVERHGRWLSRRPRAYDDVAALREVEVAHVGASAVGLHAVDVIRPSPLTGTPRRCRPTAAAVARERARPGWPRRRRHRPARGRRRSSRLNRHRPTRPRAPERCAPRSPSNVALKPTSCLRRFL